MNPRFTVSVLTFTALRQAKACIASVLQSTLPVNLILTANGNSEAGIYFRELASEFKFIRVFENSINLGFQTPNKNALLHCETEYFVMLNDDAIVPPDWLERMVMIFNLDPKAAIVGQKNACCSLDRNFIGFKGSRYEYVEFSCAMTRADLMREHGLFADYLSFANCEDSDCSLRMRELGYRIYRAGFSIQHEVGATRKSVPELREIFLKNLAACRDKWGDYLKSKDRLFPNER